MDSGKNRREKDYSEKGGGKENTGQKNCGKENRREKESVTFKEEFFTEALEKMSKSG